jgi:FkbM family methyltransferase
MDQQTPTNSHTAPRTTEWRDSPAKRVAAALMLPLIYVINRPALSWFGRGCYDLALRFNGIAINFKGRHGLTLGEERFLGRRLRANERGVLLDVGANSGAYTRRLFVLCPSARIFAFEPHPVTFAKLAASTTKNNVELLNCAVGAAVGRLSLYDFADADGSTQASLSRDAVGLFSEHVVVHEVDSITLDRS